MIVGTTYNVGGATWSVSLDTDTGRVTVVDGTTIVAQGTATDATPPMVVVWDVPPELPYAIEQLDRVLDELPEQPPPTGDPFPPSGGVPFVPEPDAPIEP